MDQLLGLLLLAAYIVGIVGFAALVTAAVIKIFPTKRTPAKAENAEAADKPETEAKPRDGGSQSGGKLYRRSKRGKR